MVFTVLLGPEITFYSDMSHFILSVSVTATVTDTEAQKTLMLFMKCHYMIEKLGVGVQLCVEYNRV